MGILEKGPGEEGNDKTKKYRKTTVGEEVRKKGCQEPNVIQERGRAKMLPKIKNVGENRPSKTKRVIQGSRLIYLLLCTLPD